METHDFFLTLLIILLTARIFAELSDAHAGTVSNW